MKNSSGCSGSGQRNRGPLVPHLPAFECLLRTRGYALKTTRQKVRLVRDFSAWLSRRGTNIEDITLEQAGDYLRYRARYRRPRSDDVASLKQLLELLREEGIVAQRRVCKQSIPLDRLLYRYASYLREERAVAPDTVVNYSRVACSFLKQKFGEGRTNLSALRPTDVLKFVQHQVARGSRKTAQLACTALRSFLQYARYRGAIAVDLAGGVPGVANWSMPSIPRSIAPDHLRRVLASCNRRSAVGSRDYAIFAVARPTGVASRCNHLA